MQTDSAAPVADDSDKLGDASASRALVRGMLAGSERAWRDFHARYDRLIYRCITKVTGRFSSFLSQDDIREIYATLLVQLLSNDMHKLRSFDPDRGNRFGSWIGLLAINAAYDYLRSMRREPNRAPMAEAEVLSCELPSPLEQVEHTRHRSPLHFAVHLMAGLIAYARQPKKPALRFDDLPADAALVVQN